MDPQARRFAERGYRVLVFDFAGFRTGPAGQPGRYRRGRGHRSQRRRGADNVVLIGSSMGVRRCLSAATRIRPPVAAVASLSGASGFGGVDAERAMARLRVPVLFVVAADDQHFTEQARLLHRAARVADKRLLIVPGGGHGTSLVEFGSTPHGSWRPCAASSPTTPTPTSRARAADDLGHAESLPSPWWSRS